MKKNYVYFIAPLAGLIAFGAVYWQYQSTYEAKVERADQLMREQREAKMKADHEKKFLAAEAAVKDQDRRKAERKAKEEREALEKEARDRDMLAREKAIRDAGDLADHALRLKKEVEETQKANAKIEMDKKQLVDEEAHMRELVKASQANKRSLEAVLERIAFAEKAAIEFQKAQAAAAAAAQKK